MSKFIFTFLLAILLFSCGIDDPVPFNPPEPLPGSWSEIAPMIETRQEVQPVLLDGKMYVIGGYNRGADITSKVEAYDPLTNTWQSRANFPHPRNHLAAAAANGKIYTFGGFNDYNTTTHNTTHEYDPSTDSWTEKSPMPTSRGEHMAVTINSKIYVIGGSSTTNDDLGVNEVYDPATDSWEQLSPMPTKRNSFGLTTIGEKIYVVAGRQFNTVGSNLEQATISAFEVYSTETDTWETLPNLPALSGGIAAAALGNYVYAIGGEIISSGTGLDICYRFNFANNEWEEIKKMLKPRHGTNGITYNNKIYILGGGEDASFGIVRNQANLVFEIN